MLHAGSNFNHLVQKEKKAGHVLVTGGVYRYLRHPSYFGFFWWGLGTQVVLGNAVCLVGYAVVLWRFFRRRIESTSVFLSPKSFAVAASGVGRWGDDWLIWVQKRRLCSSASSAWITYGIGTGRGLGYLSSLEPRQAVAFVRGLLRAIALYSYAAVMVSAFAAGQFQRILRIAFEEDTAVAFSGHRNHCITCLIRPSKRRSAYPGYQGAIEE